MSIPLLKGDVIRTGMRWGLCESGDQGCVGWWRWTSQRRWLGRPWTHMAVEWSQAVSPSPCMMKQAAIHIWLSVPHCPSPISLRRHNIKHVKSKPLMTEFKVCSVRRLWRFVCLCSAGAGLREMLRTGTFSSSTAWRAAGVVDYSDPNKWPLENTGRCVAMHVCSRNTMEFIFCQWPQASKSGLLDGTFV